MTGAGASPRIEVTEATTDAERAAVYRLRRDIYIEEMGFRMPESALFHDPVDRDAIVLQVLVDDELLGTGRILSGARRPFNADERELYDLPRFLTVVPETEIALFERVMMRDSLRGGNATTLLFFDLEARALADGATVFLLDSQPQHLLLYERLGFRPYRGPIVGPPGPVFCLAGFVHDLEYLDAVGSVGIDLVRDLTAPPGRVDALRALLSDRVPVRSEVPDAEAYRAGIFEWLRSVGEALFPAEMGVESLAPILDSSFIAEFPPAMPLLHEGMLQRTLYLVLDGDVEVVEGGVVVGTSGRASFTGDVAFLLDRPRMSQVRAGPDGVTLLGFGIRALQQAVTEAPAAAAVLYRALAADLARKLRERQVMTSGG